MKYSKLLMTTTLISLIRLLRIATPFFLTLLGVREAAEIYMTSRFRETKDKCELDEKISRGSLLPVLILVIGSLTAQGSWANCNANVQRLNFPNPLLIPRNAAVGESLGSVTFVSTIQCDTWSIEKYDTSHVITQSPETRDYGPSSITGVRRTGTPGIGIRWTSLNSITGITSVISERALNDKSLRREVGIENIFTFTETFELVKIGPVASGVFQQWTLYYRTYGNKSNEDLGIVSNYVILKTIVQPVACSVSDTSIIVPMGRVSQVQFAGVGSTAGEQSFTIPLDCDAGTKVNVTLDGSQDSSGATGVLALDSSSDTVASGVGLQLLHKSQAVTLGKPIALGAVVSDGVYSIPLVARYYQTRAIVTAGQANSTATFTLTYN